MLNGRWIAVAAGLAAAVAFAAPAGAGVRSAASDQAILQAGVLTAADVPSTWTPTKQPNASTKNLQPVAACKGIVKAVATSQRGPKSLSPQFSDPTQNSSSGADNTVNAYKSVSAARQYLAAYQASSAQSCFQQAYSRIVGTKGHVTVAPVTNLQGVGDESVGYEASLTETSQQTGQPAHFVLDLVVVRVGRATAMFNFANNEVRIPQGPAIVNVVVARLRSTSA